MNRNPLQQILYILVAIIIVMLSIKFIMWLSPVIILALIGYYIYKLLNKEKNIPIKKQTKKKPIKIIDMVEDDK